MRIALLAAVALAAGSPAALQIQALLASEDTTPGAIDSSYNGRELGTGDKHTSGPISCNLQLLSWINRTWAGASSLEVLDVGGGRGEVGEYVRPLFARAESLGWECIDIVPSEACAAFDGDTLSNHTDLSKDVVLFNYILHHAADHTISLLREAHRVARQHVVVAENMQGDTQSESHTQWLHEWHGAFRSRKEWMALFDLLGFRVVHEDEPARDCAAPYYITPNRLFVLEKVVPAQLR